jgi:ligand-binding SRPBCC domain-containing protein
MRQKVVAEVPKPNADAWLQCRAWVRKNFKKIFTDTTTVAPMDYLSWIHPFTASKRGILEKVVSKYRDAPFDQHDVDQSCDRKFLTKNENLGKRGQVYVRRPI